MSVYTCPCGMLFANNNTYTNHLIESGHEIMLVQPSGATKYDGDKPRLDLISRVALVGLGKVMTFGAKKYAEHNWRKGMNWSRPSAAALRHLLAFIDGEDIDSESGLPHIDAALCNVMFLSEYQKLGIGKDDRYKGAQDGKA